MCHFLLFMEYADCQIGYQIFYIKHGSLSDVHCIFTALLKAQYCTNESIITNHTSQDSVKHLATFSNAIHAINKTKYCCELHEVLFYFTYFSLESISSHELNRILGGTTSASYCIQAATTPKAA